jgi:hypothetical protein
MDMYPSSNKIDNNIDIGKKLTTFPQSTSWCKKSYSKAQWAGLSYAVGGSVAGPW